MASVIPSQVLGVDLHEASEEELSVEGVVRVDVGQFVLPLAPLVMHLFYPLLGEGSNTFPLEDLHDVDEDKVALQVFRTEVSRLR